MSSNRLLIVFLLVTISFASPVSSEDVASTQDSGPLLVVVLMVKDEASVICATLKPFVDTVAHMPEQKLSFLVFDTGSTDTTIPTAQQYFEENGIYSAVIKQEPFIDFATSRNRALELAQQAFPNASFMLMPDAEWYMHNVESLIKFCMLHKNDTCSSYFIRIKNSFIEFDTPRLIRCRSGVCFVGSAQEVLNEVTIQKVGADCFFEWGAGAYGQEKSQKRWLRDLDILLRDYEKKPFDSRSVFYIAQTYHCLDDLENARLWYNRRSTMQGWDEENFMTRYRLAQVHEALGNWDQALSNYLAAFTVRPSRAEPLIRLAHHYCQSGEYDLCFLFSRRAVEIPYPQTDTLFIDKALYDYTRYDLLGISAWYVNKFELGKLAVLKALQVCPDAPHLHANLAFYSSRAPG